MKNITLLLAGLMFTSLSFAQETDNYNRALFKELKEMRIEMEDEKEIILSEYDKIIEKTKDESLKEMISAEKEKLQNKSFNNSVKSKGVSVLDKADLKGLTVSEDKFNGSTNIYNRDRSGSINLSLLISKSNNMYVRFRSLYKHSDWIFYKYVTLLSGDKKITLTFDETDQKITKMGVEESGIILLKHDEIEILNEILSSGEEISVRFSGDSKYHDSKIVNRNKNKMIKIFEVYQKLKAN